MINIDSLFLEQTALSEKDEQIYRERLVSLGKDEMLQKLHKLKKVECINKVLQYVLDRKFEEAYGEVGLLNAIIEYETLFESAEEIKPLISQPNTTIKY